MKLSKKKTCERCRAVDDGQYMSTCDLGFKVAAYYTPAEACLKPLTEKEYCDAVINKDRYKS